MLGNKVPPVVTQQARDDWNKKPFGWNHFLTQQTRENTQNKRCSKARSPVRTGLLWTGTDLLQQKSLLVVLRQLVGGEGPLDSGSDHDTLVLLLGRHVVWFLSAARPRPEFCLAGCDRVNCLNLFHQTSEEAKRISAWRTRTRAFQLPAVPTVQQLILVNKSGWTTVSPGQENRKSWNFKRPLFNLLKRPY